MYSVLRTREQLIGLPSKWPFRYFCQFQSDDNNSISANVTVNQTINTNVPATTPITDSNRKLIGDYEKTVTDKENALINTFSNLIENNLLPTQQNNVIQENNVLHNNKTNGKLVDFNALTDDQNVIIKSAISNGNGHTLINLDNKM